jgi:hypothetical protein
MSKQKHQGYWRSEWKAFMSHLLRALGAHTMADALTKQGQIQEWRCLVPNMSPYRRLAAPARISPFRRKHK